MTVHECPASTGGRALQLADEIFHYQRIISEELYEKGRVDAEKARILADLQDYFMFLALRAEAEETRRLVALFEKLEARADKAKDRFHSGFFFTLAQLLRLRHEIARLPSEKIGYEDWRRSFKETLRKLGVSESFWPNMAHRAPWATD